MRITDRISQLLETKSITKYKFCKELGLSNGFLDKSRDISTDKYTNILAYFTDVNSHWLLTGEGEMLKKQAPLYKEHEKPVSLFREQESRKPVKITEKNTNSISATMLLEQIAVLNQEIGMLKYKIKELVKNQK